MPLLESAEKAYCQALLALKAGEYEQAADWFLVASPQFANNREFLVLHESTRLLVEVRQQLQTAEQAVDISR